MLPKFFAHFLYFFKVAHSYELNLGILRDKYPLEFYMTNMKSEAHGEPTTFTKENQNAVEIALLELAILLSTELGFVPLNPQK